MQTTSADSAFVFLPEAALTVKEPTSLVAGARRRHLPFGVFPVSTNITTATHSALRLVALRLRRYEYPHGAIAFSELVTDEATLPGLRHGFGRPGVDPFLDRMQQGSAAVVIHTHGNGPDMRLGHSILCAQADALRPAIAAPGERSLPCQAGGPCLRERLASKMFVGAATVHSPIVVFLSCASVHAADGLLAPRFTYVAALLRGEHAQGIVGSFLVRTAPLAWLVLATRFLEAGGTLGELTYCLNDSVADVPGYVCLGDPDLRLQTSGDVDVGSEPDADEQDNSLPIVLEQPPDRDGFDGRRALQAILVRSLRDDSPTREVLDICDPLLRGLEACAHGRPVAPDADRLLCELLARFLAEGVFIYKHWLPACRAEEFVLAQSRHACGEALLTSRAQPMAFAGGQRRLWACVRCGTVGDTPGGAMLPDVRVRRGIASAGVTGKRRGWIAGGVEGVGFCSERPPAPIPFESNGASVVLPITSAWEMQGLRWFATCLVVDGDFTVVRTPLDPSTIVVRPSTAS